MDFTGRKLKGAGPLSVPERIGFFNHVTLAVTPERLCLGVLDASLWTRDFEGLNKLVLMKLVLVKTGNGEMTDANKSLSRERKVIVGWKVTVNSVI